MRWYIQIGGRFGVVPFDSATVAFQTAMFLNGGGYDASVVAVPR